MTVKSILCPYQGYEYEASALQEACRRAAAAGAELRILYITGPIAAYPDLYGADVRTLETEALDEIERAQIAAASVVKTFNLPFSVERLAPSAPTLPRAIFSSATVSVSAALPPFGRVSDLVVIGRAETGPEQDLQTAVTAILETGAPVLVMPSAPAKAAPGEGAAVVAWDGSLPSSRALRAVAALLPPGRLVQLLRIRSARETSPGSESGAVNWLELQGYRVHVNHSGPFAVTAAEAVLRAIEDMDASLVFMGGYGHSHQGEMLWGGVTQYMLRHARTPLCLCH